MPCGIIAMVLAGQVKGQIVREEVSPTSAGIAKAGWICGLIGLILGGVMLLFLAFVIVVGIGAGW